jgi:hypothetical protein
VTVARLPADADVVAIGRMMSVPERIVRIPLRIARRRAASEQIYQDTILGYWRKVQRLRRVGFRSRLRGIAFVGRRQ